MDGSVVFDRDVLTPHLLDHADNVLGDDGVEAAIASVSISPDTQQDRSKENSLDELEFMRDLPTSVDNRALGVVDHLRDARRLALVCDEDGLLKVDGKATCGEGKGAGDEPGKLHVWQCCEICVRNEVGS